MIKSPALICTPVGENAMHVASNVTTWPLLVMLPAGQPGFAPIAGSLTMRELRDSVLSTYITVIRSVFAPAEESGLVMGGPSSQPGSTALRLTLHTGKVSPPVRFGRLIGAPPLPRQLAGPGVYGNGIPPVGIPVPAM